MKKILLFILISLNMAQVCGQEFQTVTGIVFHDLNNNSLFDAGEPGIGDVAVSNGTAVELTDEEGRYKIELKDDAIIFVIKPGNFNYPVNENNLPQFYYNHKPGGSPGLKYTGVYPTGDMPKKIDFPLLAGSDSDAFSMIVFSDPQAYNETQVDYYDHSIVEELIAVQGPEFGITLGDIVGDRLDLFEPTNRATARIGLPWFHVLGNHDMNFDATIQEHADETFERVNHRSSLCGRITGKPLSVYRKQFAVCSQRSSGGAVYAYSFVQRSALGRNLPELPPGKTVPVVVQPPLHFFIVRTYAHTTSSLF